MGVYISNIEKPNSCCALLADGSIDDCIYLTSEMSCKLQPESKPYNWEETYETCPIIEYDNFIYNIIAENIFSIDELLRKEKIIRNWIYSNCGAKMDGAEDE